MGDGREGRKGTVPFSLRENPDGPEVGVKGTVPFSLRENRDSPQVGNVRNGQLRIVHSESSCGWGGQELRILVESEGLLRRGHDVRLVCPAEAPICDAARRRGVPVDPLPIARRNLAALRAVRRWLKEHPADVINTHSSTDSWLMSVAAKLLGPRTPVVRTRHIAAGVRRGPLSRWLYTRGANVVVTTGGTTRRALIEHNRFPAEQIVSIPTGIDTDYFVPGDRLAARRRLGLPEDKTLVGIVATLRSWKGHRYLVEAFARLADEETKKGPGLFCRNGPKGASHKINQVPFSLLVIVGGGPQRENLDAQISALGLSGRVLMPGNQEDVLPWLHALDLFALPSYANEGVPQALLQALSCELPVVTTPVGSIEEAVTDGRTGLLVPPEDPAALAEALRRLMADEPLRRRLGSEGRRVVVERFGIEAMLDRMEALLRRVAAA